MRKFLVIVLLLMPLHSHATSAQDIWYIPAEDGWGMNVVTQGGSFGFALYVYDQNRNPTWYLGAGSGSVNNGYTGQMYSYRGPYFGGVFSPSTVSAVPVGTFTFQLLTVQDASLVYTINGVSVFKSVRRLSVGFDNLNGGYVGALVYRNSSCTNAAANGNFTQTATFNVSHTNSFINIDTVFADGVRCSYTGAYSQEGRYGRVQGSLTCNNGQTGTFDMFEVEGNSQGLTGRFTSTVRVSGITCSQQGRLGGLSTSTNGF